MPLEDYEIAILLKMFDEGLIGKAHYISLQRVRSKILWTQIASAYKIKKSFDTIARRLVKKMLLSDDGKSMEVLYLDKLGLDFVIAYIDENPNSFSDLETKLND